MSGLFIHDDAIPWENFGTGITRKIMSYDDRLMLVKVAFQKDAIGTLHQHPHTQISFVESGAFEVEIGGQKQTLSKGDVFYIPPNAMHGVVCIEEGVLVDVFSPMREDFIK